MKTTWLLLLLASAAPSAHAINCLGDQDCMDQFQSRLDEATKGAVTGERDVFAKCGDVDRAAKDSEDVVAMVAQCLAKSNPSLGPYHYGVELASGGGLTVFTLGDDSAEAAEAVTELSLSLVKHPRLYGVPVQSQDRRQTR